MKRSTADILEALRTVETMASFQAGPDTGPKEICQLLFANIGRALEVTALGLFLKPDGMPDYTCTAAMPGETREAIASEFTAQAQKGHVDHALHEGRLTSVAPLVVREDHAPTTIILCPIATPQRTWGIALAFSTRSKDDLGDEMTLLPNVIAAQVARIMEIADLAKRLMAFEKDIDKIVQVRHAELLAQCQDNLARIEMLEHESASRSELISLLGHELRTPLTSIISLAGFLLEDKTQHAQTDEFTLAINNEAERMHRLLTDVMDLAKMEAGKLRYSFMENDFNHLVELCVASLNGNARERNITIKFEKDETLPLFEFAPDRLQQAIVNMLSNAIKFSNENSQIILTTRDQGDKIYFSVQDFGVGIAARDMPKVFNKFEQIDHNGSARKGYGFGMPLAKSIIDGGHGGKMWLKSDGRGHGTTFFFTLPKHRPMASKELRPSKKHLD